MNRTQKSARLNLLAFLANLALLGYVLGQGGSVPVYVLTFVNISLFLMAMLIYSAAILVQYGRTDRGDES